MKSYRSDTTMIRVPTPLCPLTTWMLQQDLQVQYSWRRNHFEFFGAGSLL